MYKALDVAKYVVDKCIVNHEPITNLFLQKILYFVQAEFLVVKNLPCFDEEIFAWNLGPVVRSVYQKYKFYGGSSIVSIPKESWKDYGISEDDRYLIDGIIEQCMVYSKKEITELVQNQKPWKDAYQNNNDKIISKGALCDYFV